MSIDTSDREIAATRVFDAPRELVFRVWTDPRHVVNWWGPDGFTITTKQIDVRPGGLWVFTMHGPDGTDYPNRIQYREIVPPEKIVYFHSGEPDEANPDEAVEFESTILFIDHGGKTEVSMRAVLKTKAMRDMVAEKYGAVEGMQQHVRRMGEYLKESDRVIYTTRVLPANRDAVYAAFSDPKRLAKWWGPKGFSSTFDTFEFKPGGLWRFTMHGPAGKNYPNEIRFVETAPERIVFEHLSGHHFEMRVTLDDMGERTRIIWRMQFDTAEECGKSRKIVIPSNEENLDRLEQELGLKK